MKHVLVPVDGSDHAGRAAALAGSLARALSGSITLLYVYDLSTASVMGLARQSPEEIERIKQEVASGTFATARAALDGLPATEQVQIGHPAQEIVGYARSSHVDMIVMGCRGLSPLQELLLGSVSDHVLRHAHCPVLVVR